MRIWAFLALVAVVACGPAAPVAPVAPVATKNPTPTPSRVASAPPTEPATSARLSTPEATPVAQVPSVACTAGAPLRAMAMVASYGGEILYDVDDPVHPKIVCRIAHTSAHIVDGTALEYLLPEPNGTTAVVRHSVGTNAETTVEVFPADLASVVDPPFYGFSWQPNPVVLAYVGSGGTDANGFAVTDVWVATTQGSVKLFSYSVGGVDAFGRPGLPPPILAMSADNAYVVAGWGIKGSSIHVIRLSDHADVTPPPMANAWSAFWSQTGHMLFIVSRNDVQTWTPESGLAPVPGTKPWQLDHGFSPDGSQLAFTALSDTRDVRPSIYDFATKTGRVLIDQPRSGTTFIKAGWIWYLEEKACVQPSDNSVCFDPTQPDGNVLALDLSTGKETPVVFAPGESFLALPGSFFLRGDLWPAG